MRDITNKKMLWFKGGLFLALGLAAAGLLVAQVPTLTTVVLVIIAVWAFSRAYYFAFYVVEHYTDPGFRFSGLIDFVRYMLRRKNNP